MKKDNGKIRLVNNFIAVNRKTIAEQYPINNANELVSRVAGSQHISRIDLGSAYWQTKLANESQKLTGFQTEFGSFCYRRLPMGFKCSSFACQRLLDRVLRGMHRFTGALQYDR